MEQAILDESNASCLLNEHVQPLERLCGVYS